MGAIHTREVRTSSPKTSSPITLNVALVWQNHTNAKKHLRDTVSVTPLWTKLAVFASGPPCVLVDLDYRYGEATTRFIPVGLDWQVQAVIFNCPPRMDSHQNLSDSYTFFSERPLTWPDIKVTVNFTELLNPTDQPGDHGIEYDSLKIYLALTNKIDDETASTLLIPGTNLVGVPDLMVRQRLKSLNVKLTIGSELIQKIYDTFLIARMAYTTPDPLAAISPDYPTGPNVSTFRIVSTTFSGEWTTIQDYRTKSVMGGFAEVGGLGTFLSIVFVVLFGNSLLGIVYPKARQLEQKEKELRHALAQLQTDIDSLRPDIALICERLVLFGEIGASVSSSSLSSAKRSQIEELGNDPTNSIDPEKAAEVFKYSSPRFGFRETPALRLGQETYTVELENALAMRTASLACPTCRATVFEENIRSLTHAEPKVVSEHLVKAFDEMNTSMPPDTVKQEMKMLEDAIVQFMVSDDSEMAIRLVESLEGFERRAHASYIQSELRNKRTRRALKEKRMLEAQVTRLTAQIQEEREEASRYQLEIERTKQEIKDLQEEEARAIQQRKASKAKMFERQKLRDERRNERRKKLMADLKRDEELHKFDRQMTLHSHFMYTWQEEEDF
ncbi:hypothetical protein H1R20_g13178, partial [Candolleomyces eurysporus]